MVRQTEQTSETSSPTAVKIDSYFRIIGDVQQDVYVVELSDGSKKAFLYVDTERSGEIDPEDVLSNNDYEAVMKLHILYTEYLSNSGSYWSQDDPIREYIHQYIEKLIKESGQRTSIMHDENGGYWVVFDEFVASLEFRDDCLTCKDFIFKKFTVEGTGPNLIPLSQEEQSQVLSMFKGEEVYDTVGYPFIMLEQYQMTAEQKEQLITKDHFTLNDRQYSGMFGLDGKSDEIEYFEFNGFVEPDGYLFEEIEEYLDAAKRAIKKPYVWLNIEETTDQVDLLRIHCQMALENLFGISFND